MQVAHFPPMHHSPGVLGRSRPLDGRTPQGEPGSGTAPILQQTWAVLPPTHRLLVKESTSDGPSTVPKLPAVAEPPDAGSGAMGEGKDHYGGPLTTAGSTTGGKPLCFSARHQAAVYPASDPPQSRRLWKVGSPGRQQWDSCILRIIGWGLEKPPGVKIPTAGHSPPSWTGHGTGTAVSRGALNQSQEVQA
ncbi:hypothetical protein NDU88_002617 [Pleurodeles waltl]|uniref:Uncharacterized protein n=1 Tax=Pleurodeles waltl TaxID=8319 RepID=A0AAV7TLP8_PLEWA|nr:hypothetical protein NDU88_002617 [Pleurodeles waltl]